MDALSGDRLAGAEVVIALIYRRSIIPSYWESWAVMGRRADPLPFGDWDSIRDGQPPSACSQYYHDWLCVVQSYGRWRNGTLSNKSVGRVVLSDPHLFPRGPVRASLIGNHLWKLAVGTQYNICERQFITFVLNIPDSGHPYWCFCGFFFFFSFPWC